MKESLSYIANGNLAPCLSPKSRGEEQKSKEQGEEPKSKEQGEKTIRNEK